MSNVSSQSTTEEETEILTRQTVLLDIPPRLQWNNGNGYCGETALQSIGLYYGAWISQKLIYDINNGEYLLQPISINDHRNPLRTLEILHFTYSEWDWINSPQPHFRNFCRWMKQSIIRKHPVIFGIFLPGMDYEDYDHIVPAVGIRYKNENEYDQEDELIYYVLNHKKEIEKKMSEDEFGSTRETIDIKEDADDGCIPLDIDYSIAITGIVDEDHVTLPVRLSVPQWNEPNPTYRKNPREMVGTITVNNLTIGKFYALLRYSSYTYVPTQGDEDTFLQSQFEAKHEFMATTTNYVYEDPQTISSTGSVYYRCIRIPE
ncbi:unnamed protein product [Adineta steineri]|uniref:Uncharacterized protein n=1 Tax=Adineta steineri TaxID=433720 RepID=A0A815QRX8_9BILA|nr:unnamed protein product [Adineta steineri]CAF1466934.1 unnamed protein product [Adineta steineri]